MITSKTSTQMPVMVKNFLVCAASSALTLGFFREIFLLAMIDSLLKVKQANALR